MPLPKFGRALVLAVGVTACDASRHPETQSLLQGASVGREHFSPCPPDNSFDWKVSSSPEFEARLKELVSRSSSEQALIKALSGQGFHMADPPCANDAAVRSAMVIRDDKGLIPYAASATAYWRVNDEARIEWVHGTIAFSGL
jgi:hypothetical protein